MADAVRDEAIKLHNLLLQEWNKQPQNLKKIEELLNKLKLQLTKLTFLPTNQADQAEVGRLKQDLIVARDVLEVGALWSVASKNTESFERYIAQLKSYYFDYKNYLPESVYMYQLLGLNLLALLSQNRVAEFHTELELLPADQIHSNVYISRPVELEQWLMEGCYNKVFLSQKNVPAPSYSYFIDILINTIRIEIAACIEAAYERISINEAARLLFFNSVKDCQQFVAGQGLQWTTQGPGVLVFPKRAVNAIGKVPAQHLAEQAIEYAKELEMIV